VSITTELKEGPMLSTQVDRESPSAHAPVGTPTRSSSTLWGRFMGFIHGDRYRVGAYAPEWQGRAPTASLDEVLAHEEQTAEGTGRR
jgi:hypothetical protein